MMTIAELLEELETEGGETRRVLERVPAGRLDWRPHPRSFTLGQLAMHVATLPSVLVDIAAGGAFDVTQPIPRPSPASVEELLATHDRSVGAAREGIAGMGEAGLGGAWRAVDGERELFSLPRGAFLRRFMLNHWYHHRGQLTVYLRLAGADVPGVYGSSADDVPSIG